MALARPARGGRALIAIGLGLVGFALLIAVWQLGASPSTTSRPRANRSRSCRTCCSEPFYDRGPNDKGIGLRMLESLQRVFMGFGLAVVVGVPLGLLIGASKRAWQMFNPIIQMLRPVSPLAWFPIWLIVFSDGGRGRRCG